MTFFMEILLSIVLKMLQKRGDDAGGSLMLMVVAPLKIHVVSRTGIVTLVLNV